MSIPPIRNWRDQFPGEASEDFIRSKFVPGEGYRVSSYRYPAQTKFSGSMLEGTVFVISGSCEYDFGSIQCVSSGEFTELPGGNYSFAVTGDSPVELVLVWKIT